MLCFFSSLLFHRHANLQVHAGDMSPHENLTRLLRKGFQYYGCIDIHVSFLSDSADKTKRASSTNPTPSSCLCIFIERWLADETRCITVWAHFSQLTMEKCCLLTPGLLWRGDRWAPQRRFVLQSHHGQLSTTNLIKVNDSSALWEQSGPRWAQTIPCDRRAVNGGRTRILMLTSDALKPRKRKWR